MFLFHKCNLTIENMSGNKQVFKATFHLDITNSQDAEEFIQGYCDYNRETTKHSCRKYNVYFH